MSQINHVSIPVRMGSKQFKISHAFSYNYFHLNACELIEIVLNKVYTKNQDMSSFVKTYCLYENSFGVERLIGKSENLLALLINQTQFDSNVFFVIRKKTNKTINRPKYNLNAKKCFKKLQIQKEQENKLKVIEDAEKQSRKSVNLYEDVERSYYSSEVQLKQAFLKQILTNEIVLNQQMEKIETFDKILIGQQDQKSNSKSFFKSIYSKLKYHNKQNKKEYNLDQSSIYLLDSAGECSSNSSSRSTSSSKLDTLF